MRLANVTALELARKSPNPTDAALEWRVVAYVPEQQRPVYISEARRPETKDGVAIAKFNPVSFRDAPVRRSFRLALQLWTYTTSWSVLDGWVVDLRHVRRPNASATDSVVLVSDDGPVVPVIPMQEVPPNGTADLRASDNTNAAVAAPKPPSQSRSFRLFGWGSNSAEESKAAVPTEPGTLVSLSYAMLVDIWTLQHSLDDARAASSLVSTEINELLPQSIIPLKDKESVLTRRLAIIQKQTHLARERTSQIKELATQKRASDTRVNDMLRKSTDTASQLDTETRARPPQRDTEELPGVAKELSRLASQLLEIFPIDPIQDGKFHFTIRGLALPSVFAINHYDPIQVGAALGFVAQVVVLLSQYLDVALPYPITVYGSQSFIADNISSIKHGSNKFPLWTRGALLYRVEYALYLLHKDIEQLMNAVDLAVADLKQTLANLKNLLLVVSHK